MVSENLAVAVDWLFRNRIVVAILFIAVLVVSFFGASQLQVNPNNRVFFSDSNPEFRDLIEFENTFDSNTNVAFVVSSNLSVFDSSELLEASRWLTSEAWHIDGVVRVDSIFTYPHGEFGANEIELSNVGDFVCPAGKCNRARGDSLLKQHLVGRLVSADAKTLAVVATVQFDIDDPNSVSALDKQSIELVERFRGLFPDIALYRTGAVPMMQAFMDASNEDLGVLVPVATFVFFFLLWVFLGSLVLTTLMLVLGIASIVVSLGIFGLLGYIVNTATATTPLVIFTLVTAASMHVFLYVSREAAQNNLDVRKVVARAFLANAVPLILAAITSVVGLLSLIFVSAPPIRELGIISACGVVVGTVLLLTVVPALLSMLPSLRPSTPIAFLQRLLNDQARRVERNADRPLIASFAFVVCLLGLPLLTIDEDFVRYFSPNSDFRSDAEAITSRLSGPYHAEIVLDSGESGGIYQPELIALALNLATFLRQDDVVANVLSVTDILSEVSLSVSGNDDIRMLSSDELAQYFLTFELALAKGQSTTDFVDIDHRKIRISVLFGDTSMAGIRRFESRVRAWYEQRGGSQYKATITGEGIPTAHLSGDSIRQMGLGIGLSLLVSAMILGVVYRSMRVAIVALSAIAIPTLAGFGVWGALVGSIGMAATMVVAVTIGVVIDDSIHLLYRHRDGLLNLDLSSRGAAAYSLHRTGAAVITTSIVLAGGFSVLMVSGFRMNSTFGICSALVIALALVYNIWIMPRLLSWSAREVTQ